MLYTPIPQAVPFHDDDSPSRTIYGENRSGKTIAAAAEVAWMLRQEHYKARWAQVAHIVGPNMTHIGKVCWPALRSFLEDQIEDIAWLDRAEGIPWVVHLKNGARAAFYTEQETPPKHLTQPAILWIDEPIATHQGWLKLNCSKIISAHSNGAVHNFTLDGNPHISDKDKAAWKARQNR